MKQFSDSLYFQLSNKSSSFKFVSLFESIVFMDKKYFVLKLSPSRSDFAQTMTDEERSIMQQHVVYWKDFLAKGMVIVFGPVFHPEGTYGLGIVCVEEEKQVQELIKNDPASAINQYEYYPMMAVTATS